MTCPSPPGEQVLELGSEPRLFARSADPKTMGRTEWLSQRGGIQGPNPAVLADTTEAFCADP